MLQTNSKLTDQSFESFPCISTFNNYPEENRITATPMKNVSRIVSTHLENSVSQRNPSKEKLSEKHERKQEFMYFEHLPWTINSVGTCGVYKLISTKTKEGGITVQMRKWGQRSCPVMLEWSRVVAGSITHSSSPFFPDNTVSPYKIPPYDSHTALTETAYGYRNRSCHFSFCFKIFLITPQSSPPPALHLREGRLCKATFTTCLGPAHSCLLRISIIHIHWQLWAQTRF